jgi:dTDP-4-dehydrorhamnose 3,5-epimerase
MKEINLSVEEYGLKRINYKQLVDERGIFKKVYFSESELKEEIPDLKEIFFTFSKQGTIRGMHIQGPTHPMQKLIMVIDGVIIDIIADCDTNSKNYGTFIKRQLTVDSEALFIPTRFAHGYQVLSETAIVMYLTDTDFCPSCDSGFNYGSLEFQWPYQKKIISEKDSNLVKFTNFDLNTQKSHP